jgi:hypothetical protein
VFSSLYRAFFFILDTFPFLSVRLACMYSFLLFSVLCVCVCPCACVCVPVHVCVCVWCVCGVCVCVFSLAKLQTIYFFPCLCPLVTLRAKAMMLCFYFWLWQAG